MCSSQVPGATARKLAQGADRSESAIVVGNRAGIIEWANDAWTRVTGYALDESVSKPVQAFLERADVGSDVVEFVAGCFRRGTTCEVELPFRTPSGRQLWIQLRVEPLVDESGDVSDFIATAKDISGRKRAESAPVLGLLDLGSLAADVASRHGPRPGTMVECELELEADLPVVLADASILADLTDRLFCRAIESVGGGWGTITIWTGVLGNGVGPIFCGALRRSLPAGHYAFLEVHDTGGASSGTATDVTEPFLSARHPRHVITYAAAERLVRAQGGELRLQSLAATGTSVVLLFPFASEPSGWSSRSLGNPMEPVGGGA
jgi:PAS domain S-box-containing protein